MVSKIFAGKRVLVTGHTGFKGSWLTLALDLLGAKVLGISLNPPSKPELFSHLKFSDNVRSARIDITDSVKFAGAISNFEPEMVFHLAAMPTLLKGYDDPVWTYQSNVMGTINLLEAIRQSNKQKVKTKAVLNITTDKVYDNSADILAYKETDRLGGHDPYSASKACSEIVTASYRKSFLSGMGIGVATARAGNVIGFGDWGENRIVPNMMRMIYENGAGIGKYFITNGKLKVRESTYRPWSYITNIINGYLMLMERLYQEPEGYSEAWNFASDYSNVATTSNLARRVLKNYPPEAAERFLISDFTDDTKHEDKTLILDSVKSRIKLGWDNNTTLEESCKRLTAGYEKYYRGKFAQSDLEKEIRKDLKI
jgi:CDP-glucose 4,6-dehydratase